MKTLRVTMPGGSVCQDTLKRILLRADHPPIKNLETKTSVLAIEVARNCRNTNFEFGHTSRKIKWIKPLIPTPVWENCWRTAEASILQPAVDWGRGPCWIFSPVPVILAAA